MLPFKGNHRERDVFRGQRQAPSPSRGLNRDAPPLWLSWQPGPGRGCAAVTFFQG